MDEFDIIVVGGGSGGSAAAGRLSEDPNLSVCVIEAGGRNDDVFIRTPGFMPFIRQRSNYRFDTVPQKGLNGRTGYQPRGRGLGGSSAINAMLYIRGSAWDYDNWRDLGCTGWGWDDVLPVFKACEANERGADAFHGADGPLSVSDQHWPNPGSRAFVEAAAKLQLPENDDFNGARQEGFGLYQTTQKNGERWSAARAFLDSAMSRPNLDVRTGAVVERVLIADGRASGVVIVRAGRRETIRARCGVVLAGGAFGTPQTLMLSGIGPGAHLAEHDIPVVRDCAAVGSDLQDHVDYVAGYETEGTIFMDQSLAGLWAMAKAAVEHKFKRTGAMTTPYAEAGGFWRVDADAPAPDIQFHFVPAVLEDHGRTKVKGHGFSCHVCVLRPESRGTVRLGSPDPTAAPLIDPAFLTTDYDMRTLREGVRLTHRICTAPPLDGHKPKDRYPIDLRDDEALDALIRRRADTVYHPVGTARMGNDAESVCDPTLKVRGVGGLWIADASVMPRLVSGNTNAPSIMIGWRAAAFVKDALA
jgi:choline dehydrogenase-like flavoprotein